MNPQMTEETHNAAVSGPVGIVMAITTSAVLGWFLILGLLFSIQDLNATVSTSTGEPVAQIFLDTVGEKGAIVLMVRIWQALPPAPVVFAYWYLNSGLGDRDWRHVLVRSVLYHIK